MAFLRNTVLKFLSAVNYYYRAVSVFHHPGKMVLRPAEVLRFTEPEQEFLEYCGQSFNFEPDYRFGLRQKEISVTKLENVTLLGNSGALIQNDRLITESVFDQRRQAVTLAWRMPAIMWPRKKAGLYTSIFHFPWAETSNYHWFFDCLPRLYSLSKVVKEPITLAVPEIMPQFQRETLDFVLQTLPNFNLEVIRKNEKWHCERFLLPSFIVNIGGGYLPEEVSSFLRERIFKGYQIQSKKPNRKIYLSRSTATKRRILNETELLPILEKYGFEIVHPEKLSYREQVQLFHESSVIVGPHGAGFTNTFFAQKATVFELHPANVVKAHYFLLSKSLDFDYHYLIGSEPDKNLDFTVSVKEFEAVLNKITLAK